MKPRGNNDLVAGIDLSGRTTGTTAIAWLRGDGPILDGVVDKRLRGASGDDRIVELISDLRPAIVAVDAPLHLPHAVTCTDPACELCFGPATSLATYSSRRCDSAASWKDIGHAAKGPMPTAMLGAIAFRGMYLRRQLNRIQVDVIETWPMAVYRTLAGESGNSSTDTGDAWRYKLLEPVVYGLELIDRTSAPGLRDRLDSVAAAYLAWKKLRNGAQPVPGLPGEGEIWTLCPIRIESRG